MRAGPLLALAGMATLGAGLVGYSRLGLRPSLGRGGDSGSAVAAPNSPCDVSPDGIRPPDRLNADTTTSLGFTPDGRLWWTERTGAIYVWQGGRPHLFTRVATVITQADGGNSEFGLTGFAISPSFNTDRHIFAMYTDADYLHEDVVRFDECRGDAKNPTPVVTLPAPDRQCCHVAGRIAFGPDGDLYVALGDESTSKVPRPGFIPPAQQVNGALAPQGKILRYRPDGTVPDDNPFGPGNPTWVYGLRNPFGIAFDDGNGLLITSNGPSGDALSPPTGYDTIMLAIRGGNYEWPYCFGYGQIIPGNSNRRHCGVGGIDPDWSSGPSAVVPTGPAWIRAGGPPDLVGHWVVCTVNKGLQIMTPDTPHWVATWDGRKGCQLDVVQAPDGTVYYSDFKHVYRYGADR
jgi:glucose/arabinose dehydrogenase